MTATDLLAAKVEYVIDETGQKRAVLLDITLWQEILASLQQLAVLRDEQAQADLAAELEAWDALSNEALTNVEDEQKWAEAFAKSQDALAKLADEVITERRVGLTEILRALGQQEGDEITWFWIGPHADYDKLLAQL